MRARPVPGSVQDSDDRAVRAFCAAVLGLKIDGVALYTMELSRSVKVVARAGDWAWSLQFSIEELRHSDPILLAEVVIYRPVKLAIAELAKEQRDAAAVAWARRDRT